MVKQPKGGTSDRISIFLSYRGIIADIAWSVVLLSVVDYRITH